MVFRVDKDTFKEIVNLALEGINSEKTRLYDERMGEKLSRETTESNREYERRIDYLDRELRKACLLGEGIILEADVTDNHKFTAKSRISQEDLDSIGIKHKDGYVEGWYVDGYIVGEVVEANGEYIALTSWVPVNRDELEPAYGNADFYKN